MPMKNDEISGQAKNNLIFIALAGNFRRKVDYRRKTWKELQQQGYIQAVSGKLMVTYELTETGKQAVLQLDDSIANGIFPTLADIKRAQDAVRASMIEGGQ